MPKLTLRCDGVTLQEFELRGQRITIGRRSDNPIQLDDPTVSGRHASLTLHPDPYLDDQYRVVLQDMQSTNGVFVNGERVSECPLHHGDVIRLGMHELVFDEPGRAAFERTAIHLCDE